MRILYSHRVQSHDGQGVHIEELIRALREAGHEVQVVGPAAFARTEFGGENRFYAAIRRLLPGARGELAELAYTIPAYFRLKRAWRSFRPDLVYARCNLFFLAGAWLARRWHDPAFPKAFPWFAEPRYWEEHYRALEEQLGAVVAPPLEL